MELYHGHTNQCLRLIVWLRKFLPGDVVYFIVIMYWELRSDPVLAFLMCKEYNICLNVYQQWEFIKNDFVRLHPRLRIREMKWQSIHTFEPDKSKGKYREIPLFLLIPGPVWDASIIQRKFIDNIETISCESLKFDTRSVSKSVRSFQGTVWCSKLVSCSVTNDNWRLWLNKSMNNEVFLQAQNTMSLHDSL